MTWFHWTPPLISWSNWWNHWTEPRKWIWAFVYSPSNLTSLQTLCMPYEWPSSVFSLQECWFYCLSTSIHCCKQLTWWPRHTTAHSSHVNHNSTKNSWTAAQFIMLYTAYLLTRTKLKWKPVTLVMRSRMQISEGIQGCAGTVFPEKVYDSPSSPYAVCTQRENICKNCWLTSWLTVTWRVLN